MSDLKSNSRENEFGDKTKWGPNLGLFFVATKPPLSVRYLSASYNMQNQINLMIQTGIIDKNIKFRKI